MLSSKTITQQSWQAVSPLKLLFTKAALFITFPVAGCIYLLVQKEASEGANV